MTTPRLPLERFPFVRSHSLEESVNLQSSISGSRCRAEQVDRRLPFEWRANAIAVGPLGIVAGQYGAGVRGHIEDMQTLHSLSIPLAGNGEATQNRKSAPLIVGRKGVLGSSSTPADIVLASGYCGIQVVIPAEVLESTLDVLTGVSRSAPLRFDFSVDLEQARAAGVLRLLDFLLAEADRDASVLKTPAIQARLADAVVCSLLLGLPHNYSRLLRSRSAGSEPVYLRRAEEYLAANAQRPVTVSELATVAGVSAGTLFAAFRAHHGCSPMAFLRARRLGLARTRLLTSAGATVSEIALSCGFEHLGRFSVAYRKRFGETPRQTLERARDRGHGFPPDHVNSAK